ncbi:MAG: flagellar basal body P-ring formation chaperone FlgA [Nannocystaceae bacterium]
MKCYKTPRISPKVGLLALALALLGSASAKASNNRPIEIEGSRIELGALTPSAPRELAHLDIAPSPQPGRSTQISRDAVRHALRRAGADPRLANALPPVQRVVRASKRLSVSQLKEEVLARVRGQLPPGIGIIHLVGVREVVLPVAPHTVEVRLTRLRKSTSGTVIVKAEGRSWARFPVTVGLEGRARTPVPKHTIARTTVIRPQDLVMVDSELHDLPQRAVFTRAQLVGQAATRSLRPGRPIQSRAIKAPPTIQRGRTVTLVALSNGLRITQSARAEEDGTTGDWIRVHPLTGSRAVKARVISPSEVRIDLGPAR